MISVAILSLALTMGAADARTDAPLVPGAIELDDLGRYDSPRSFDDTVEYYERYFRGDRQRRWRHIVNLPTVRAQHVENKKKESGWSGINIYEHRGKVRIYVIPNLEYLSKPKPKSSKKKR
jgi:hypothetical protein